MIRLAFFIAIIGLGGVLAACATLSKAECTAGDWRSIGIGDGAQGYPASYIDNHISACAEHGITLNRQLYEAGRQEGLGSYCRLGRAESDGRAGRTNYNSCQGEIGVAFGRVHTAARGLYDLNTRMTSLDSELNALVARLANAELTAEQRAALGVQIRSLQDTRVVLERERSARESELATIRRAEEQRLAQANIAY